MEDDTHANRRADEEELDTGSDVFVVAHSYGGVPPNNALEHLDQASRSARGLRTSVLALVFLCSGPLSKGESFLGGLVGKPWPIHKL